jgi:antitoxin MazE6
MGGSQWLYRKRRHRSRLESRRNWLMFDTSSHGKIVSVQTPKARTSGSTAHKISRSQVPDAASHFFELFGRGTASQVAGHEAQRPCCWVIALEVRYNHGYTRPVKTAISIPDSLFEEAERLAKTRGWSRSELYANAVTAYVDSERFAGVREKLDAVYADNEEDSAIDPLLAEAQARSLPREKW